MISGHNNDTINYILKNVSKFELAMEDMLGYRDGDYYMNIAKSKNRYGIYIYYDSKQIHKFNINKNDYKFNDIKSLVNSIINKQNKNLNDEILLVRMLGKDSKFNKIKKN